MSSKGIFVTRFKLTSKTVAPRKIIKYGRQKMNRWAIIYKFECLFWQFRIVIKNDTLSSLSFCFKGKEISRRCLRALSRSFTERWSFCRRAMSKGVSFSYKYIVVNFVKFQQTTKAQRSKRWNLILLQQIYFKFTYKKFRYHYNLYIPSPVLTQRSDSCMVPMNNCPK